MAARHRAEPNHHAASAPTPSLAPPDTADTVPVVVQQSADAAHGVDRSGAWFTRLVDGADSPDLDPKPATFVDRSEIGDPELHAWLTSKGSRFPGNVTDATEVAEPIRHGFGLRNAVRRRARISPRQDVDLEAITQLPAERPTASAGD